MSFVAAWARAFAVTCGVELLVAVPLLPGKSRARASSHLGRIAVVLLAQLATHPAVWFVFPALRLTRTSYMVGAELWAVLLEALLYGLVFSELPWTGAFGVAALANGASFAVGLLLKF